MTPTLIELTPNRQLLDSNFDGYKLSLKDIPSKRRNFSRPVDRILLNSNQYSLLHAKLYGLHNHLIGDPFDENDSVYFVDNQWNFCKVYLDPICDDLIDPIIVWQLPKPRDRKSGDYNVSLKFVSNAIAVVGDGSGIMYIINTGSRKDDDTFSVLFSDEVAGQDEPFVIVDAVLKETESEPQELDVLLLSLKQETEGERYSTILHWITLKKLKDHEWGEVALKQLKTKGFVQYAALEKDCEALYVVSDNKCRFILNSDCPVKTESENSTKPQTTYKWSQDIESINVKIPLPENSSKNLVTVKVEPNQVEIKYEEKNLIVGQLHNSIDANLTTWSLERDLLEVQLSKIETGLIWPEFVKDDQLGEYVIESCIVEQVHERLGHLSSENEEIPQSGTTFNSQQVEECDFETDKSTVFERLCGKTNEVTHKANLGSHQVLINANLDNNLPLALGIRHDVDVCLWQPQGAKDNFKITHEGTLLAFGYVQASKQNRKFSVCPPDLSYSVICESTRHLFIYRQRKPVSSGELRNRNTGRRIRNIAEQQVISISNDEILGLYSTNASLFLLLDKSIIVLKL